MATPKIASFTSGVAAPYAQELQVNAQEQQQLLEALQHQIDGQSGVKSLQSSGSLGALNFEGVGNVLAEQLTRKKLETARKKQADVQGMYQSKLLEEGRKYATARDGATVDTAGPPEEGQGQPQRITAPNPLAFRGAALSQFPEMRTMAEDDRKSYETLRGELLKKASPGSALASPEDIRGLKPEVKQGLANGAVIQYGTQDGELPKVVAPVTQTMLPSGTLVNNEFGGGQNSVDKAPKITATASMNNNPGSYALKGVIDALPENLKAAEAANQIISASQTAMSALKAGAKSGAGEEYKQAARTSVESLTGIKFEATTPTAVLAKALAELVVQEFGGKLGGGVSMGDLEFMKQAQGGLATDASAIERILAIRAAKAMKTVDKHNAKVADMASQPNIENGDFLKRQYTLERTKHAFEFKSPEARASFESGLVNIPYETALKRILAEDAKEGAAKKPSKYSPADLELFRKNGYVPQGS